MAGHHSWGAGFSFTLPRPALLLTLVILLLQTMTGGVSALGHGSGNCKVKICSRQYGTQLQQRADELVFCQALTGYLNCLRENARSCRGNLEFHSTVRGLQQLTEDHACMEKINSVPSTTEPPPHVEQTPSSVGPGRPHHVESELPTPEPIECTYNGPHLREMRHCGLFGDPHLKTFEGALQTCRVRGAWPLIDSPYLAVQVTNEPVRPGSQATVTTKVTVIVKGNHSPCTPEKVYEAQAEHLPDTFLDGSANSGPRGSNSVTLHVVEPDLHVEIRIRHLAARLLIRRVAGALSFSAQMPLELALPPGREHQRGSRELCSRGCPTSERLPVATVTQPAALNQEAALAVCRSRNLSATYLEWCVFDVMTTGDKLFGEAAFRAQADVIHLDPSADAVLSAEAKWLYSSAVHNRTYSPLIMLSILLLVVTRTLTGS